jgi:hypothetical protein
MRAHSHIIRTFLRHLRHHGHLNVAATTITITVITFAATTITAAAITPTALATIALNATRDADGRGHTTTARAAMFASRSARLLPRPPARGEYHR